MTGPVFVDTMERARDDMRRICIYFTVCEEI